MRRLSGPLLMATGGLDLLYVLVFHSRQLAAIAQDGFFDAVELAPAQFDRETVFWHLAFGMTALILGALVRWAQARTGTLPALIGWSLLALGLFGVILVPVSGFWVLLPLAVLMLAVSRRGTRERGKTTQPDLRTNPLKEEIRGETFVDCKPPASPTAVAGGPSRRFR